MKLRALRLWNVRRFGGQGIAIEGIGDGVNVLSAENERGKSTCFDALHALFFQPHTGTPTPVRLLRPYSGGSPLIEADIETPEGMFRLRKQFYGGRSASVVDLATGRLLAQADEAEAWIGDLVRDGVSGPAGLLWVRQGSTEIGGGTAREKDDERRAREDLMTSVAGEVEALTGGRRMVRVMARCEADLDRYLTPGGRPKAGGPLAQAIEQLEELRGDEQAFADQLSALREALEERRGKDRRLRELKNPEAEAGRRQDKEQTTAALEQAKIYAEQLRAAEAGAELEAERQRGAAEALQQYDDGLARAAELAGKVATSEDAWEKVKSAHDAAVGAEEAASAALEGAEAKVDAARNTLAVAEAARRAGEAAAQLTDLESRLGKAEEARRQIEALSGEHATLALSDEAVERLATLEQEIAEMRAAAAAAAATITMSYMEGGEGRVLQDGAPLPADEVRTVTARLRLEIADIGVLIVAPGLDEAQENTTAQLREAEDERRQLLAELGLASLGAAKDRQRQAAEKAGAIREAKAELKALAPEGIETLKTRASVIRAQASNPPPNVPDPIQAKRALEEALTEQRETRTEREVARSRLASANENRLRTEVALEAAQEELRRTEEMLGPPEGRNAQRESLARATEDAELRQAKANKAVEALLANSPDVDAAEAAAARAASAAERAQLDASALEREISELTGRITTYSDNAIEESYEEVKGRRKAAEVRLAALEVEVAALSRLKRALEDARIGAKEQYFGPVMGELRPLLALLLDEASITFDDTTLLPQSLVRNGQEEQIAVLSGGMREQLAILTRLAFARLSAKGGRPVPVILDDGLVYCDDNRIERMFDVLHRQARDLQILVFTCRQRAFERLGGQGLQMKAWQPNM